MILTQGPVLSLEIYHILQTQYFVACPKCPKPTGVIPLSTELCDLYHVTRACTGLSLLTGGELLYNIMLTSAIQHRESAVGKHTPPPS